MATGEEYDQRIRNLILWLYKNGRHGDSENEHLVKCPDAYVKLGSVEAFTGTYGCDTGCDAATLEGTITCPHGKEDEFDDTYHYGAGTGLEDIIRDAEELERTGKLSDV